jgi:hypothetical protein
MSATATRQNHLQARAVPDELPVQKLEEHMAADLRQLERDLRDLDGTLQHAEQQIEQRWRQAHLGYAPNRPWAWPTRQSRRGLTTRHQRRPESI